MVRKETAVSGEGTGCHAVFCQVKDLPFGSSHDVEAVSVVTAEAGGAVVGIIVVVVVVVVVVVGALVVVVVVAAFVVIDAGSKDSHNLQIVSIRNFEFNRSISDRRDALSIKIVVCTRT